MSFFSTLFGASVKYSRVEHPLTTEQVRHIMWSIHLPHINQENERAVSDAILARRHGDGKISLQQIYETLRQMETRRVITLPDRKSFMDAFKKHFAEHFRD